MAEGRFVQEPRAREESPDETPDERAQRIIQETRDFVALVESTDGDNAERARKALRFKAGEQWPENVVTARSKPGEERPCLTLNEILPTQLQLTNDFLMNPPGLTVEPGDSDATVETAQVIEDKLRAILHASSGTAPLAVAFENQVDIGRGFVVVYTKYVSDDSFDQEICLGAFRQVVGVVYFDPHSVALDGSDATECVIVDMMRRADFEREYPEAEANNLSLIDSQVYGDWLSDDSVQVAERYYLDYEPDRLFLLNNGSTAWESQLQDPTMALLVQQVGVSQEQPPREVQRRRLKWCKLTAVDLLDERMLPGSMLPVVPFYGNEIMLEHERKRFGSIEPLEDPQLIMNYAETAKVELVGLQPKAPWVGPEGFAGLPGSPQETAWKNSNIANIPYLEYSTVALDGQPLPAPPQRQPFPAVPAALVEMREAAAGYIQRLSGIAQPVHMTPGNNRSQRSLREQDAQSSLTNYHYIAHAKLSLMQIGRIILGWLPYYYNTKRLLQTRTAEGTMRLAPVNTPVQDAQGVTRILHDLTKGTYALEIAPGPDYQTKRDEANDKLMTMGQAWPQFFQVAGSDIVRSLDIPGGSKIAQKLAVNEPAVPELEGDPQVALAQLQGQLQQVQQQAQALNVHAQQLETGMQQLTEENRELRIQQTALKAQMQGDQAEATVAKKVYDLSLQEQQMTFQQAELRLQAQIARLQEQLAQVQTRLVASTASNGTGDSDG